MTETSKSCRPWQGSPASAGRLTGGNLPHQPIIIVCPPMSRSCLPVVQAVAGQPSDRNEARGHEDYHLYVENIYARLDLPTIVPELLKQLGTTRPDLAEAINKDYVCESSWAFGTAALGALPAAGSCWTLGCRLLLCGTSVLHVAAAGSHKL